MKRGQPQCVLSVDISTCVDTISYFVGIEGWGEKEPEWIERHIPGPSTSNQSVDIKRLLPFLGATPSSSPLSPDISSNWRMGTSPT